MEEKSKNGDGLNKALFLIFGVFSITNSIFILHSLIRTASGQMLLMDLLSRIILAAIFLAIGSGTILFILKRPKNNEEEEFWKTLKDTYTWLPNRKSWDAIHIIGNVIENHEGINLKVLSL